MLSLLQLLLLLTKKKKILSLFSTTEQVRLTNHAGKTYELKITDGAINCTDLGKIKDADGEVTRSYDPAYMNTVSCISRISYIDGDKGILEYRGYPIEQLAEKSTFLECSFLIIYGELPTPKQLSTFTKKVMKNSSYH